MPLSVRQRGKIWYARGTIHVGTETIYIPEFSTRAGSRAAALSVAGDREAAIRREVLEGDVGRKAGLTLADCFEAYIGRPGGVPVYDAARIADFNVRLGHRKMTEAGNAWAEFLATRGAKMAPATASRWRAIYMAAIRAGAEAHGAPVPSVATVRERTEQVLRTLTEQERTDLLAAYGETASPVFLTLAYQGLRTSEALRLDWRHVHWVKSGSLYIPRSKSGKPRSVPMHHKVRARLHALWESAGKPDSGPVFLSGRKPPEARAEIDPSLTQRGRKAVNKALPNIPYADTRGKGGSPLRSAHRIACKRASIQDFRIHDWRHDWAARMVMAGVDLFTLMKLGGWSTLRMVEIYGSSTSEHMASAVQKIS